MKSKWKFSKKKGDTTITAQYTEAHANEIRNELLDDYMTSAAFATFEPTSQEWNEPIPFDEIHVDDFPIDALPKPIADFVGGLAVSTQTPPEMAGILALPALSTAFQTRYSVKIKADWKEPLCVWGVAVAPPAERKSAVLSALLKPVYEYESEQRAGQTVEIARSQADRALLEKSLQATQNKAAKGKGDYGQLRDEMLALATQLEEFEDVYPLQLLADDITSEKLTDLMEKQKGCITIASSEGGIFDIMNGRYDKNCNFDIYLKGHAGDPVRIDRIGRSGNSIESPKISMILTVQPQVINGIMANATLRGRGLCARFLFAICRSNIGKRMISPPPIPSPVKESYRNFIMRILSDENRGEIILSDEALTTFEQFQSKIETKLSAEWEFMQDWGGKLAGATARIAALLHAADADGDASTTSITRSEMNRAIKIAECLSSHAEAAFQIMGEDVGLANAKYLWKRIEQKDVLELTKRELFNECKAKFKKVENMESALRTLEEMSYIRMKNVETGGRPSVKIIVNPLSKSRKSSKTIEEPIDEESIVLPF